MAFSIDFLDDGRVLEVGGNRRRLPSRPSTKTTRRASTSPSRPRRRSRSHDPPVGVRPAPGHRRDRNSCARRPGFRRDEEPVLAVDVAHIDCVTPTRPASAPAVGLSSRGSRLFQRRLLTSSGTVWRRAPIRRRRALNCRRSVQRPGDRNEQQRLRGCPSPATPSPARPRALDRGTRGARHDPDVLVCSTSGSSRPCTKWRRTFGRGLLAGRWPDVDYQQLAGRSTAYSSYGRVGRSPARYNVARSGDHRRVEHVLLRRTNLDGVLSTSCRIQKSPSGTRVGRRSGTCSRRSNLKAGQRPPRSRPVELWRHEFYKPIGDADARTAAASFSPRSASGNVHELDFSSLYPNIICTRNVSPDVIRCSCQRPRGRPRDRILDPVTTGATSSTSTVIIDARDEDQGGHPSLEGTGRPAGTVWRNSRTVGSFGVDPRRLFRLAEGSATSCSVAPASSATGNQRVRSRDSAVGRSSGCRRRLPVVHGVGSIQVHLGPRRRRRGPPAPQRRSRRRFVASDSATTLKPTTSALAFVPELAGAFPVGTELTRTSGSSTGTADSKIRGIEAHSAQPAGHRDRGLSSAGAAVTPDGWRRSRASDERVVGHVTSAISSAVNRVSKPLEGYSPGILRTWPPCGRLAAKIWRSTRDKISVRGGRRRAKSSRDQVSPSPTKRARPTTPRTTRRSWSSLSGVLLPLGWDHPTRARREARGRGRGRVDGVHRGRND